MTTQLTDQAARNEAAFNQLLHDIFVTALEGGIQYWAKVTSYRWSTDGSSDDLQGFSADLVDTEVEPGSMGEALHVNRQVVANGYALACGEAGDHISWSTGEKPPAIVVADEDGYYCDPTSEYDIDLDAGDADCILQLGLFGKVVYG